MTADVKPRLKLSAWMQQRRCFLPLRKVRRICRQLAQHVDVAEDYGLRRQECKYNTKANRTCKHKIHTKTHFTHDK